MRPVAAWLVTLPAFAALAWAVASLPTASAGLTDQAYRALDESGVSNPVTAVLLNYRSYDTLLEVAVLLLAVVAVWSLQCRRLPAPDRAGHPLLRPFLGVLLPLLCLVGVYLLWIGAFAPGGAFQGGALLGGAVVLWLLGGGRPADMDRLTRWLRWGLVAGLVVFIGVGALLLASGRGFLEYPPGAAKLVILFIEAAAMVSIGLTLGNLFVGGRPAGNSHSAGES